MEQEITLRDLANYLDNIGIQFLATIGLDGKPKVRPMQYTPPAMSRGWRIEMSLQDLYISNFNI